VSLATHNCIQGWTINGNGDIQQSAEIVNPDGQKLTMQWKVCFGDHRASTVVTKTQ